MEELMKDFVLFTGTVLCAVLWIAAFVLIFIEVTDNMTERRISALLQKEESDGSPEDDLR